MSHSDALLTRWLLAMLMLLVCATHANEGLATPMCREVRGFASEYNTPISIAIQTSPAENEAIILIVRAFPLALGELTEQWVQMNATYRLREGATVSVQSNNNGIVMIPNVEAGTDVKVELNRVRRDGPVPFRFWSYHANRPECFIDVSPTNSFFAPIPTLLTTAGNTAKVYFKSIAPQGAKGLMVQISNNSDPSSETSFQVMSSSSDNQNGTMHKSGEIFAWNGSVVYFAITPYVLSHPFLLLGVKVVWTDEVVVTPSTAPSTEHPIRMAKETNNESKWSFFKFLLVVFVVVLAYFITLSIVNYRVKGITEFPEMIPHINALRSCSQYVSLVQSSLRHGSARGDYRDLNRQEISTQDI